MKYKRFRKAIVLLLSLIMTLGVIPATSFAQDATKISQIEINDYIKPVEGAHPNYDITIPAGAHYHFASKTELEANNLLGIADQGMLWYIGTNNIIYPNDTEYTFISQKTYTAHFFLVPDKGYSFDIDAIKKSGIKINGTTFSDPYISGESSASFLEIASNPVTINYEIKNITLMSFAPPVVGAYPDEYIYTSNAVQYRVAPKNELKKLGIENEAIERGFYFTNLTTNEILPYSSTFAAGNTYSAQIILIPAEDAEFDLSNLQIIIESKEGGNIPYTVSSKSNKDVLYLELGPFTPIRKMIVSYDVNGGTKGPTFFENNFFNKNTELEVPDLLFDGYVKAPENMEFKGYEIDGKEYKPGETYKIEDDITIKFLWKEKETLKPVNPSNPSEPDSQTSEPDSQASKPDSQASKPDSQASKPDSQVSKPDPQASKPDPQASKPDPQTSESAPQTSDNNNVSMWMVLGLISMCGTTFVIRRKRKEN